jgi:hypothetical protein
MTPLATHHLEEYKIFNGIHPSDRPHLAGQCNNRLLITILSSILPYPVETTHHSQTADSDAHGCSALKRVGTHASGAPCAAGVVSEGWDASATSRRENPTYPVEHTQTCLILSP